MGYADKDEFEIYGSDMKPFGIFKKFSKGFVNDEVNLKALKASIIPRLPNGRKFQMKTRLYITDF